MSITASTEDKKALSNLGGDLDNLVDLAGHAIKMGQTVNDARNPMTNAGRTTNALKAANTVQKAYTYTRHIQDVLDEKKRDGALLKLGLEIGGDLAEKLLGMPLTSHPYYTYHKAIMEALADALNASRNSKAAVESYRFAVSAANSQAVEAEFKRLESRRTEISASYSKFKDRIGTAADIARGLYGPAMVAKKVKEFGSLERIMEALFDLHEWRAMWAGLAFDAMQLQVMAGAQVVLASGAMRKVKELIDTLMAGSTTSRVGGYSAVNNINWDMYDEIVVKKKPAKAYLDPVAFAQDNVKKATVWAQTLAQTCDWARTSDAIYSNRYAHQVDLQYKALGYMK